MRVKYNKLKKTKSTNDEEKDVSKSKYPLFKDWSVKLRVKRLTNDCNKGIVEILVIPKNASTNAHDFWSLYNSKIFKAKKKDRAVKIIGAKVNTRWWEKNFDNTNNNQAIKLYFIGFKDEDSNKESP